MDRKIIQTIKDFGIDTLSNTIYTYKNGALRNGFGTQLDYNEEQDIRDWHDVDNNEIIYAVFTYRINTEANFLRASGRLIFTSCIRRGGISFAGIIESEGWNKENDKCAGFAITWNNLRWVSFKENVTIRTIDREDNACCLRSDPAFNSLYTDGCWHCNVFHLSDGIELHFPTLYFSNYNIEDFINSIIKIGI